jgi:hypothetical protein
MKTEPAKKIKVTPASDIAKLLHDAAAHPILLENNGELYRLERMENTSTMPTPEEVVQSGRGFSRQQAVGKALP